MWIISKNTKFKHMRFVSNACIFMAIFTISVVMYATCTIVKIFGKFAELILLIYWLCGNTQFRAIWSNLKHFTNPRRTH